ncbi:MAG TPA: AAA family ATPase [Polyangium sp.]|nr:AAA family ATPase [Polyangium sp.]
MHIRKIVLENVRCFDRVELDLTRPDGSLAGWTVLAGRNGTGKSTLLKAIALAVAGPRVAGILQRSFLSWIKYGETTATATVNIVSYDADDNEGSAEKDFRVARDARLEWVRPAGDAEPHIFPGMDLVLLDSTNPQGFGYLGPWSDNPSKWFIAGYGPQRRIGNQTDFKKAGRQMEARLWSLFDEETTLAESLQWLRDLRAQHLELREKTKTNPSLNEELKNTEKLYQHIVALLNDGLLPDDWTAVGFDLRSGLMVERNGLTISITGFSDGYRAAIALVLDIVRQMHRCFNERLEVTQRRINGKNVIQVDHEGIVLIDEVDAHLHVSWQQRIGFWLKQHFPNIQFIVTTHSPFVCQAADPKGLIRLPLPGTNERVEHVSEDLYYTVVNGDVDDAVMSSLFGLERPHSEEAEKLRSRIAKLEVRELRGVATKEEKDELERLLVQLPKNGNVVVEQALRKLGEMG